MKNSIISVITDYLNSAETDYALMINGAWGSGKTHFVKNKLFDCVRSISVVKNEQESSKYYCKFGKSDTTNYNPVYISLYGLDSIENIYTRIVSALFPILNNKALLLIKAGLKSVADYKGINTDELRKIKVFEGISTKDVLFFDDLERIDNNKIDIQSVLGYLNYLSEHDHYKVIVIANDEKLNNDYQQFKEKTIRFSLNYTPDISEVFDSVLQRYKYEDDYFKFLIVNKDLILNIFNASNYKNIRTLIFVTDVFKKIFSQVTDKYKDEINRDLLIVFIIIAIEAKNGSDKDFLKEVLQQLNPIIPSQIQIMDIDSSYSDATDSDSNKSEKIEFAEKLSEQYQKFTYNLTFYPELFDLVFDGYVSTDSSIQMINDVRNKYVQQETSESQMLVNKIVNWTIIPNKEFYSIIDNIKKAVSEGNYGVNDIFRIYASFIQIESMHISGFSVTSSDTQLFKTAIEAAMQGMSYSPYFDIQALMWDDSDKSVAKEKYNELRNFAVEINKKHKKELNQTQRQEFLNMIQNAEEENLKNFISDTINRFRFVNIDPKEIVDAVILSKAEIKQIFYWGLMSFFPSNQTPSQEDISFLGTMKSLLDEYINKKTERTVDMANLIYSQKYLDKILTI